MANHTDKDSKLRDRRKVRLAKEQDRRAAWDAIRKG